MKKLNIGCGKDIKKDWINLDITDKSGADFIWDLNRLPLPFKNDEFDYILCSHVLEHFNSVIPLLDEFMRIGKEVEIRVPNETCSWLNNIDHKRAFTMTQLLSYADRRKDIKIKEIHYYGKHWYGKIGAFINNILGRKLIDYSFLRWLFPYVFIKVIFEKINTDH